MTRATEIEQIVRSMVARELSRRRFLKMGLVAPFAALPAPLRAQASYRVGAAVGPQAYDTAQRAMDYSGEWPLVAGRVVVIKPNLVAAEPPESGAVTDPEVVRAVVDRSLQDGAALVLIVEASPDGPYFKEAGYQIFENYDPNGRVQLLDLHDLTVVLAPNPMGWIYKQVYMAELLALPDVIFINVAKLKTHLEGKVTLTAKNLFGIPDVSSYISSRSETGRFAMHDRGVSQTIFDLNLLRPSDFSLIDGIWGMEGRGPLQGDPVKMDTVLAGKNSVAVDRVGLEVMEVPQIGVRHLSYLSLVGLGPWSVSQVDVSGDPLVTRSFAMPDVPPEFDPPKVSAASFAPGAGESIGISVRFYQPAYRKLEILEVYDDRPDVTLLRTLKSMSYRGAGMDTATWDGRAEDDSLVAPGRYAVRITAYALQFNAPLGAATGWVTVV